MNLEALLLFFVGVTALAIVIQGLAVWKASRTTSAAVQHLQGMADGLQRDVRDVMDQVKSLAADVEQLKSVLENLGRRASEAGERMEARIQDLEALARELADVGKREAEKLDRVVDETVERVRQTTGILQEDVLRPLVEIGSILKAVRTGFDYLFARRPDGGRRPAEGDEDLFI
ncbi:MAG: hypothetical protein Kow00109_03330 [Acidobacteriota bacterium]